MTVKERSAYYWLLGDHQLAKVNGFRKPRLMMSFTGNEQPHPVFSNTLIGRLCAPLVNIVLIICKKHKDGVKMRYCVSTVRRKIDNTN